jgi:hypothetical protein
MGLRRSKVRQYSSVLFVSSQDLKGTTSRETLIKTHPSLQGGLILIHETAARDDSASLPH